MTEQNNQSGSYGNCRMCDTDFLRIRGYNSDFCSKS